MQKFDRERHYRGLESVPADKQAVEAFEHKPYQAAKLIRTQGEQMEKKEGEKACRGKGNLKANERKTNGHKTG